jgi:protein-tyrosine-phosphatase
MRTILFICTANIARSPLAEYAFQKALAGRGVTSVLAESAGTMARDGVPAASMSVKEGARRGLDISHHRSRLLTRAMVEEAEMVLVMERHQYLHTLALAPGASEKTFMLASFIPGRDDDEIADPYGGDDDFFRRALDDIVAAVEALAGKVVENLICPPWQVGLPQSGEGV